MTSFLFRALIYYHVKKNNASQLKQFLQNLRQSSSGRAQQTQKTRKITAFQISQHSTTDWSGKTRRKGALANSSVQKRHDMPKSPCNGTKTAWHTPEIMLFCKWSRRRNGFVGRITRRSVRLRISRLRFFRLPQTTCRRSSTKLWSPSADRYKRSSCAHLLVQNMRIAILMFTAWKFCSINYFYVLSIIYQ